MSTLAEGLRNDIDMNREKWNCEVARQMLAFCPWKWLQPPQQHSGGACLCKGLEGQSWEFMRMLPGSLCMRTGARMWWVGGELLCCRAWGGGRAPLPWPATPSQESLGSSRDGAGQSCLSHILLVSSCPNQECVLVYFQVRVASVG